MKFLTILQNAESSSALPRRVEKVIDELEPFLPHWEQWKRSQNFPLNEREIYIVESYLSNFSHHETSEQLQITVDRVRKLFRKAIKKLTVKFSSFLATIHLQQDLEQSDMLILSRQHIFLTASLEELGMATRLFNFLKGLSCRNMQDVLEKFSRKKMLTFRNFGIKTMTELEEILKKNNCLHLLKND